MNKSLHEIFRKREGKASDKWEHYFLVYERLFAPIRDRPITLVEVGVQNGGSLEVWAEYFPNARHIEGIDIDPLVGELVYQDSRISVHVADGTTEGAVEAIGRHKFPIDVFIDDGSHLNVHVIKTFLLFFPLLREGGIYVVEDTHTSYFAEYDSHLFAPGSMMTFFQRLADVVNREHWDGGLSVEASLEPLLAPHGIELGALDWIAEMDAITFTNSMIIIQKRSSNETELGLRFSSGSIATVVQGLDAYAGKPYVRHVPFADPRYPTTTPEQDLAALRAALDAEMAELKAVKAALASQTAEIEKICSTRLGRMFFSVARKLGVPSS